MRVYGKGFKQRKEGILQGNCKNVVYLDNSDYRQFHSKLICRVIILSLNLEIFISVFCNS